jgi:DNA-binding NtrC family response regulator
MQVKLLRVLDGVPYYRVGGQRKVTVDARIVAATNQDLETAVKRGRFRSDLYHRLNQCPVRVPPLRDRRADIVPLAEFFLRQHTKEAYFSADAKAALERYAWPGNVREVRNVVTTGMIAARSYEITAGDLQLETEDRRSPRHFSPDPEQEAQALSRRGRGG